MKAIVHIGMPKTGSTALQNCLHASAAYLAERGLLYPESPPDGRKPRNHRLLLAQVASFEGLSRRMKAGPFTPDNINAMAQTFLDHVRRQIETQRPEALILSTEGLFTPLPEERRERFRESFRALGAEPRFVAYLRRPSEHYLSNLQQRLKASATVRPPQPLEFRKVLRSYIQCFGRDAVTARLFDRGQLEDGDIVADFCKHHLAGFGIEPARLDRGGRANETLSAESMDVLQRYRQVFHAERNNVFTKDTRALIVALARTDRRHGARRPALRPGVADAIDYANRDCLWIRDWFGVVFPGLDYDRLASLEPVRAPREKAALEDIIVIDRALQARIVESLAQSSWAEFRRGAPIWLDAFPEAPRSPQAAR